MQYLHIRRYLGIPGRSIRGKRHQYVYSRCLTFSPPPSFSASLKTHNAKQAFGDDNHGSKWLVQKGRERLFRLLGTGH